MTATVLEIAGMISVKRTPLDGDIEGIVARAKVVGNAAYVAFPGSRLAAAVLGGVFFTSSDVTTRDPGGSAIPGPVITAMGASPDGSGTLVQLDVDLRGLLEAICLPLTELEIPFKSIGGTTAYARGSDPRIASQPDDNLQYGLVLDLRVGAEGGDRDATALREYPILEALSILGSAVCAFQEPSDVPKSPEFQLAAHFFCSPDNTSKSGTDVDTWTLDTAATPYLHALVGRQTNKVGWLIAAAIGFLSAPTLLGAFAVAAVVGPAGGTISLSEGSKGDLATSHPVAGLRSDDSKARVVGFMRVLEDLLADFLGDHSPDVVSTKAISGRMMGSVSALARGAAVRSALWRRTAVQWDFRVHAAQQSQPPPPRPGPLPNQTPPRPGPPPRTQDQALIAASVVPTVPDSLLRLFVTDFCNTVELVAAVDALVVEADIKMVERVGQPGIPFCTHGPPLARSFARGLLSHTDAIVSAGIPTIAVASVQAGAENLFTLVEEIARRPPPAAGTGADGGGGTIRSGGAAAGAQGRCTPGWVFSALARFDRQADGARTSEVLRELAAIASPQGMLVLNALRRLICSSGKPTLAGESGSKVDLPKLALEFRTQAHEELGKLLIAKLPQYPLRAIGHGEKADRDMGAATCTALRLISSLCEDALTCKSFIPMMSQRPVGGEIKHGELSATTLEDSVRKFAPAIDYLVHSLIGMPRTNDRSFGDCLEAIVGRCCQSFDIHLEDLFAIMDDRIFRELGERLSEWRRLSQSEAASHHTAPFPDIRGLVDGEHVYMLLQADAHHRQIARKIAGPCLLSNRAPKEPKERKSSGDRKGTKRDKKPPAGQPPAKAPKAQHSGGGGPQVPPIAGGHNGTRRLSTYGASATGPQVDELWKAFDAAIALCGPYASNVPNQPVRPCFHFFCFGISGDGCKGPKGSGIACAKRHVLSKGELSKLKAQQVGSTGLKVFSPANATFAETVAV